MFSGVGVKTHGVDRQPTRTTASDARTATSADKRRFALGFLGMAKLATLVYAILGVIGGIIVAATTVEYGGLYSSYEQHPYVGWGIAAVVATLASAVDVGAVLTALSHLVDRAEESGR